MVALGFLAKFIAAADEKLADYMKRLDESDADEEKVTSSSGSGRGDVKLAEKIAAIQGKRTGQDQISLTCDPVTL